MTDTTGATLTHTIAASPDAVFDAWTTPALFATWFGGSENEVPVESVTLDARIGGTWTATMIVGDGIPEFHWRGEHVDVRRPAKLVLTMTDEPGDEREILTADLIASTPVPNFDSARPAETSRTNSTSTRPPGGAQRSRRWSRCSSNDRPTGRSTRITECYRSRADRPDCAWSQPAVSTAA